jgi:hypothetical protein
LIPLSSWIPDTRIGCSFRVSRLHKITFNAGFAVYWIHFQQARFLLLTFFFQVQDRQSRHLTAYFPGNRHFAVYWIHFRFVRTSVFYIFLYISACNTVFGTARLQIIYKIDRRASRLRNFLLTGTLLYTEITFEVPEHQPYIYCSLIYINIYRRVCTVFGTARLYKFNRTGFATTALYKIDSRVSRLRNFQLTGILPYTGFTFDTPNRQSLIYSYIIYLRVIQYLILRSALYIL